MITGAAALGFTSPTGTEDMGAVGRGLGAGADVGMGPADPLAGGGVTAGGGGVAALGGGVSTFGAAFGAGALPPAARFRLI
ncbi:hypothetical protein DPMN_101543 [Dreissena polymorpha]|uniref:Uncharacterized protein n=1 Tax=Dreissena polymorpha TaxID=45954 RepID=A0A9D4R8E6_DREPO|nr:hypothetical protein DPMN_101543 [Dreissena polymorpha]